jgi:hypothetical protein
MATSQNGWPVIHDPDDLYRSTIHGVTFPNGVRPGDVQVVMDYLMDQLHHRVEELRAGECWGWFVKTISGSSTYSNHSSGTAYDFNAPEHAYGAENTFSASQREEIRQILGELDGVVRWGGDYSGTKDEMHFEVDDDAAAVARVADKIRAEENDVTPEQVEAAVLKVLKSAEGKAAIGLGADNGLEAQKPGGAADTYATMIKHTDTNVAEILKILRESPAAP